MSSGGRLRPDVKDRSYLVFCGTHLIGYPGVYSVTPAVCRRKEIVASLKCWDGRSASTAIPRFSVPQEVSSV